MRRPSLTIPGDAKMLMQFGKHQGRSLELMVLTDPDYVRWILTQTADSRNFSYLQQDVRRLIDRFDAIPFRERCRGSDCGRPATRASVSRGNIGLVCWCDDCDPYQQGAGPGHLQIIARYFDALSHVDFYCNGRKDIRETLITKLARAKGAPTRITESGAEAFFVDAVQTPGCRVARLRQFGSQSGN